MGVRSGARDTDLGLTIGGSTLTELYWDAILLTENGFLDPCYHDYTSFQRLIVREVGRSLTLHERGLKPSSSMTAKSVWRQIGLSYTLLFCPEWAQRPIWCKADSTRLQVVLMEDISKVVKQLLMSLLEYAATLDLTWLRLSLVRDVAGIRELLRNLSWLGGRVVPNENRSAALDGLSPVECAMFSDEKYVIVEFEC